MGGVVLTFTLFWLISLIPCFDLALAHKFDRVDIYFLLTHDDDIYLVLAHQFNRGYLPWTIRMLIFTLFWLISLMGGLIFTLFWLISLMGLIFTLFWLISLMGVDIYFILISMMVDIYFILGVTHQFDGG